MFKHCYQQKKNERKQKKKKWKNNKQILNNVYNDIDDKLI